jgi:hypothetical protein
MGAPIASKTTKQLEIPKIIQLYNLSPSKATRDNKADSQQIRKIYAKKSTFASLTIPELKEAQAD